jgi:hypothetical protein
MESNHAISTAEIKQQMQVLQAEKQSVRNQINDVTMKIMAPVIDNRSAWERTREGSCLEIDTKSSLREELEILEGQKRFLDEAIEGGRKELDRVLSQESLEACAAKRPEIVAAVEEQLLALREVEKANRKLRRIRDGIESDGFRTGSLPIASYDLGGRWNDRCGGRLVSHCKEIAQNYPEVAKLAMSDLDD